MGADAIDTEVAGKAVSSYSKKVAFRAIKGANSAVFDNAVTTYGAAGIAVSSDAMTNIGLYADSGKTLSDLQDQAIPSSVSGGSENGCRCSGDDHVAIHAS